MAPISEPIGRAKNGLEPGTSCVRGLNKGLQSSSPGRWAASTLHTLKCASAPTRGCGTRVVAQYFCEFVALAGGQISLVFEAHELCSSTAENRVPTTQKGIRASCSRKLKVQPNTYLNLTTLDGRCGLLQNVIFESDAFRIVLFEPPFSGPAPSKIHNRSSPGIGGVRKFD